MSTSLRICAALLWAAALRPLAAQEVEGPPGGLTPGLQLTVHEDRYPVRQRSLEAAVAALNAGRHDGEGRWPPGLTEYHLEPRWTYEGTVGRCAVRAVQLTLEITVSIPEWSWLYGATDAERSRWAEVLDGLTEHEYAHRDVTIEVAGALYQHLLFLHAASCRRLGREVERAVAEAEEELRRRHAEVDGVDPGGPTEGLRGS